MSSTRTKDPEGRYYTKGDRLEVTAQLAGHKFRIGDIVEVIGIENHYGKRDPYMICQKASGGGGHWWMTEEEVRPVREVQREDRKYQIGNKFRIVHNQYGHAFEIGTEVVVTDMNTSTNAEYMNCRPIDSTQGTRSWWVAEWEVVEIGSEATEKPKPNRHREKVQYPVPTFNEPNQ